jgi:hypothetical protein
MKYFKFNVNQKIKVKLKDIGVELFVVKYNEGVPFPKHITIDEYKSWADKAGYHSFQLWHFMDIFGNTGIRGHFYFDLDIIIDSYDLKPFDILNP